MEAWGRVPKYTPGHVCTFMCTLAKGKLPLRSTLRRSVCFFVEENGQKAQQDVVLFLCCSARIVSSSMVETAALTHISFVTCCRVLKHNKLQIQKSIAFHFETFHSLNAWRNPSCHVAVKSFSALSLHNYFSWLCVHAITSQWWNVSLYIYIQFSMTCIPLASQKCLCREHYRFSKRRYNKRKGRYWFFSSENNVTFSPL